MIIFPAIDILYGKCVRLYQGRYEQVSMYSSKPEEVAKRWEDAGAQWIHVVDLDGALYGELRNFLSIERIRAAVRCNLQAGGGIRDRRTIKTLQDLGIQRLVMGTKVFQEPEFFKSIAGELQEKLAVALDIRDGKVALSGWTETSEMDYLEAAKWLKENGARRLMMTSIQRDGTQEGPDMDSLKAVLDKVSLPVIASGGIGDLSHIKALQELEPSPEGVIIGKALYEKRFTLREAIASLGNRFS